MSFIVFVDKTLLSFLAHLSLFLRQTLVRFTKNLLHLELKTFNYGKIRTSGSTTFVCCKWQMDSGRGTISCLQLA